MFPSTLPQAAWRTLALIVLLALGVGDARAGLGRTITVGPDGEFQLPSQAAKAAKDGDTVEIAAGLYEGDVAQWKQNDLTLRGVGGLAHLAAAGKSYKGKAIWVIMGNNVLVENIEFSDCHVGDKNGAGIRAAGGNLTIRNSFFHDNDMGILTDSKPEMNIVIENSEFANNHLPEDHPNRRGHGIYIGRIGTFILRNSYVHGARVGHEVKSRAAVTVIEYNRIENGPDGTGSFLIDMPEAGDAFIIGNLLVKGPNAETTVMVAYGNEKVRNPGRRLIVANNTFVNDGASGWFINIHDHAGPTQAYVINNIFAGDGRLLKNGEPMEPNLVVANPRRSEEGGLVDQALNLMGDEEGPAVFVDPLAGDFRLAAGSPAIDAGVENGPVDGRDLMPAFEYADPRSSRPRLIQGAIDLGAFEYTGP